MFRAKALPSSEFRLKDRIFPFLSALPTWAKRPKWQIAFIGGERSYSFASFILHCRHWKR